jgi:hypothetical protein
MKKENIKKIIKKSVNSFINEEYNTRKNYEEAISIIDLIKKDLDSAIEKNDKTEIFHLILGLRRLKRMIH